MAQDFIAALRHQLLHSPRHAALALAAASAGALAAALTAQYVFGLLPCILCIYQRIPFAIVVVLGLAGWLRPRLAGPVLWLCALALAVNAGIAFFHAGVEQHWWRGTDLCGSNLDTSSIEALRAQIMNAPTVRCDEIPWSMFGISMAGYNVLMSGVMAVYAGLLARKA